MTDNEIIKKLQEQHIQNMSDALQNGKDTKRAWDLKAAAEDRVGKLERVLDKVRHTCLFADDDTGGISITSDPHISSELFGEICDVLRVSQRPVG